MMRESLLVIYLLGLFLELRAIPVLAFRAAANCFPGRGRVGCRHPVVRQFNHWILGGYGIHTSVFPSAHVSGAFAAAFALKRILGEHPWLCRGVFVYAALVAIATVYGRYHYAVDAVAGVLVGMVAAAVGRWLLRGAAF